MSVLYNRYFKPYFLVQFLGAFNDNVYKNALLVILAYSSFSMDTNVLTNLAAGLFILPFFLFSVYAGQVADKFEKSRLIQYIKVWELALMLIAAVAFYYQQYALLIALIFFMGTQSAFFGPIKYSLLPQILEPKDLVGGNGLVEMGTYLAILLGTLVGVLSSGVSTEAAAGSTLWVSVVVVGLAVAGCVAAFRMPRVAAANPDLVFNWNPWTEAKDIFQRAAKNNSVFLAMFGIAWFWFLGSGYLVQLPAFTKEVLQGDKYVIALLISLFSIGIGIGSMLCKRLSGEVVEIGLVPIASVGLTLTGLDLWFTGAAFEHTHGVGIAEYFALDGSVRLLLDILLLGVFGGLYIVPLYAMVQLRTEESERSRIIAALNILDAFFIVMSSLVAMALLSAFGLSIPQFFGVLAVMNIVIAIFIYYQVPEFMMRCLVWVLINTLYRVNHEGLDSIPKEGPAVVTANHVSFMDGLILGGCIRRPVRFVMYYKIFQNPLLGFIFRTAQAIPIASAKEDPELLERAYDEIARELDAGNVVGIFPEGAITFTGDMTQFKKGIERIIERNPVPVVPIAIRGMWGSFFSRSGGKAMARLPKRFWSRIDVVVGKPIPPDVVSAAVLQQKTLELRGDKR